MAHLFRRLFGLRAPRRNTACRPAAQSGNKTSEPPDWWLPCSFLEYEKKQVDRHRKAVCVQPVVDISDVPGLAVSGGGIRSAIFSLGVLQAMADTDQLRQFSYVSSVSGGSYIASFYGSLFIPDEARRGNLKTPDQAFEDCAKAASNKLKPETRPDSPEAITPIAYLRDNFDYLAPNGLTDILQTIAVSMRNWFAVQYVIGVTLLSILIWLGFIDKLFWLALNTWFLPPGCAADMPVPSVAATLPLIFAFVTIVLVLSPLSRAYWLTQNLAQKTGRFGKLEPGLALAIVTIVAVVLIGYTLSAGFNGAQGTDSPYGQLFAHLCKPPAGQSASLSPLALVVVVAATIVVTGIVSLVWLWGVWIYVNNHKASGKSWFSGSISSTTLHSDSRAFVDRLRNALTNAYTSGPGFLRAGAVQIMLIALAIGALDAFGALIYQQLLSPGTFLKDIGIRGPQTGVPALAGVGAAIWAACKFVLSEGKVVAERAKKLPRIVLASILAIIAAVATLTFWSVAAQALEESLLPTSLVQKAKSENAQPGDTSDCSSIFLWADQTETLPQPRSPKETASPGSAKTPVSSAVQACRATRIHYGELALALSGVILLILAWLDGVCIQFLNLSTYQRIYSMRLTRTFLGATNSVRLDEPARRDVTALVGGDSVAMSEYYDSHSCAPVHLINTTVNKTVDWDSSLVQRGARGLSLSVGPAGITIGAKLGVLNCDWNDANDISTPASHTLRAETTRDIWLESMTLGDWVAISGAAVSTGMGQHTTSAYALLLGLANIRLGYWWDTYSRPFRRGAETFDRKRIPLPSKDLPTRIFVEKMFATQFCLADELFGIFDGPRGRRWYLTDGGHFENTGAYELVRRQLKLIVIIDNGCDPKNRFEDIANLIRRARVDFSTEIVEADRTGLPSHSGVKFDPTQVAKTFDEFRSAKPAKLGVHLVAHYPDRSQGHIVVIKPRVTAGTAFDVRQYRTMNRTFPQETTANQFFDDVQWESHRMLGYTEGCAIFGKFS